MQEKEFTGIIGAMQIEIDALKAETEIESEETISGVRYTKGRLCGKNVVLAVCGIGKVAAAVCAEVMILRYGVDRVINTGVAGGCKDGIKVLDVVIAERVCQHDMDTTAIGDPVGFISGIGRVYIDADKAVSDRLSAAAAELGKNVFRGVIASGDTFIASEEKKRRLVESFNACCCEMEGAAIGMTCYLNNVPFAILRTISDGGDGMEYSRFVPLAAGTASSVVKRFLSMD